MHNVRRHVAGILHVPHHRVGAMLASFAPESDGMVPVEDRVHDVRETLKVPLLTKNRLLSMNNLTRVRMR